MTQSLIVAIVFTLIASSLRVSAKYGDKITNKEKDIMRKLIVFDKNTPDVFYCPMQKPSSMNKLIVRSRPLHKLCEYEGQLLPEDYKSDCYKDIDESNYACKEKYRIMMRKNPPGSDSPYNGTRLKRFMSIDNDIRQKIESVSKSISIQDVLKAI